MTPAHATPNISATVHGTPTSQLLWEDHELRLVRRAVAQGEAASVLEPSCVSADPAPEARDRVQRAHAIAATLSADWAVCS